MEETILNIFVIIDNDEVSAFKAASHSKNGDDREKIEYLKKNVKSDIEKAYYFDAPRDSNNRLMPYKKFSKLERQEKQYFLFEEIFKKFDAPESPLICVTPIVDGKILSD
ncbi:MAG TPA: hypothetical protein PK559_00845 [Ignavibacteriaceae bacterium]|nr:hypothetical protein [Ignavibacteriaceae bacterium]